MKKQIISEEFHRMVKLAGIQEMEIFKPSKYPSELFNLDISYENEEKLIAALAKQVDGYDIYENNHGLWENVLLYTYDDWIDMYEPDEEDLADVSITPEEWNTLHNKMSNNFNFNYFVRNFSVGDGEQTRHEDDINKDIEYFRDTYDVDYDTARLMKKIVDDYLAPSM